MHSIKATWSGRTLALAKPNESGGKKSRNRIPREERKALIESFIHKHQRLNSGNFPSLSLTHREVGGSFYTVREIFREIIQENRVLGPAELIIEEEGNGQEQKQSQSSSILMDSVAPLSLSSNGSSFGLDHRHNLQSKVVVVTNTCSSEADVVKALGNGDYINRNLEGTKDRECHMLVCGESEASQLLEENAGLLAQYSLGSASEISEFLPASCNDNNVSEYDVPIQERAESLNGSFSFKHGENGKNVHGIHFDMEDEENVDVIWSESKATEAIEVDRTVKVTSAAATETMQITGSASGTIATMIDLSASMVVETFPLAESYNQESNELENSNEAGKGNGTEVMTSEADSSNASTVGQEMSSATSDIRDGIDQLGSKIFDPLEKRVIENVINPASIHIECARAEETVVMDELHCKVYETRESSNGTLSAWTTEQNLPTFSSESGKAEKDATETDCVSNLIGTKAQVAEGTKMEEEKGDATTGSGSSREGSMAASDRIKPESWKGGSNNMETNPLVVILKSFITAFVKFWSE